MDPFRLIADRKIQEAMEEGAFEDLSGRGQPLPLDDDPFEDPSLRMAHRLLRNNGFAPAWIEEGKEIEAVIEERAPEVLALIEQAEAQAAEEEQALRSNSDE